MKLTVLLPTEVFIKETANKILAEAENGWFCIKPRHIDFVSVLVPSVFMYESEAGDQNYLAIDEGLLVKCADNVTVSTRNAVSGTDLKELTYIVARQFRELDEHERLARTALARLEAGVVKRFIELKEMI